MKKFETPEMEILKISVEDVITASSDIDYGENETEGGGGL